MLLICSKLSTLWGSFELQNHRLAKTMIIQYCGSSLRLQNEQFFADCSGSFDRLPMYYMNFHGACNIQRVTATMASAVMVHRICEFDSLFGFGRQPLRIKRHLKACYYRQPSIYDGNGLRMH
ncbi:hypothetical protein ACOME3_003571 [Neoechinorhynchus agilis]